MVKALSIRQPWAWLVVHGYKDVENRSWSTGFRGRVLIHAGGILDPEFDEIQQAVWDASGLSVPPSSEIERGAQTALRDACTKIQDDIVPLSVLAAAQSGIGGGVLVAVKGNVDAEGTRAIVERLRRVPGVGDVEELRHDQGILRLYAPYTGELGPLYRHLTWDPYDGFRLSAQRVVARELRLEMIPDS